MKFLYQCLLISRQVCIGTHLIVIATLSVSNVLKDMETLDASSFLLQYETRTDRVNKFVPNCR